MVFAQNSGRPRKNGAAAQRFRDEISAVSTRRYREPLCTFHYARSGARRRVKTRRKLEFRVFIIIRFLYVVHNTVCVCVASAPDRCAAGEKRPAAAIPRTLGETDRRQNADEVEVVKEEEEEEEKKPFRSTTALYNIIIIIIIM